jgi:curved DNA-binding protein CbpA
MWRACGEGVAQYGVGMRDPYEVLQVHRRAEPEVIRAAFRALARKYHPDFGGDSARMVEITEAYAVLGSAERRASLDAQPVMPQERRPTDQATATPVAWQPARNDTDARTAAGSGSTIDFGRYAGWTVGALVDHDPDYLEWLARTPVGRRLTVEIEQALAQRAAQSAALRPSPKPQRRSFIRPWATAGSAAR